MKLCKGFNHVRVDLFECKGKVYFGELTFTSEGGLARFEPEEWDYKIGELWDINERIDDSFLKGDP